MTSASPSATDGVTRRNLTLPILSALVVGTMVGAGVYSLPASFAAGANGTAALIAWSIAGLGMFTLALVFQRLATTRPDLDSGIFAYARAGFGNYVGFFSAFGYWVSACVANVTYWVFIGSTLGGLWPAFGDGDTWAALVLGTVGIWVFHIVIARGVRRASLINGIATVAKLVPLAIFIAVVVFAGFSWDVFVENLTAGDVLGSLPDQVRSTMLVTVFVFIGIEGASVYSRWARKREDVGRATVLGFLSVLAIFMSVTMLSYGVVPLEELGQLRQPSMAGVLESVVGSWGAWLIGVGIIVSILGAYLAWTLVAVESLYMTARGGDAPRALARLSARDVPLPALLLTSAVTQLFLVIVHFSADAFNFSLELTSALAIIPYLLTAGFGVKLAWQRKMGGFVAVAAVAVGYALYLVYAMGMTYALLALIVYAPATVLFVIARRQNEERVFTRVEAMLCVAVSAGAVAGIVALATGAISI